MNLTLFLVPWPLLPTQAAGCVLRYLRERLCYSSLTEQVSAHVSRRYRDGHCEDFCHLTYVPDIHSDSKLLSGFPRPMIFKPEKKTACRM
jgi:hypothetical protein